MSPPLDLDQEAGAPAETAGANFRDPSFLLSLLVPALTGLHLLVTSTSYMVYTIWPYDIKRILEFGLLLFLFLVPALNQGIRLTFGAILSHVPRWIGVVLFCMFAWGVISALVNAQSLMHALNSLSEVALFTALTLGLFVVAACRQIAGRWFDRVAISLITLTGLAVGVQELIGVIAAHVSGVEFNFRISLLYFSWPRFYNQVQSWAVPALLILPLLFTRHRLAYVLCFITLGLQWYIILATGARGSFVSIGAAIMFALLFLPPVRGHLLKWQFAGFALGALLFTAVLFSFEAQTAADTPASESNAQASSLSGEPGKPDSAAAPAGKNSSFLKQSVGKSLTGSSGRIWMWSQTLRDTRENPLLGIGPMNYVCTGNTRIGHPHNFPLQLAAEWGLPVALSACCIFLFLFWRVSQSIRNGGFGNPESNTIAGLLFTGVLAAALHSGLSGVMVMPASQVTGLLLCGMLLGMFPFKSREQASRTLPWAFIPGVLLALGLTVLGVHELQTMKSRAELLDAGSAMWPRMWQDSKVCALYNPKNQVGN